MIGDAIKQAFAAWGCLGGSAQAPNADHTSAASPVGCDKYERAAASPSATPLIAIPKLPDPAGPRPKPDGAAPDRVGDRLLSEQALHGLRCMGYAVLHDVPQARELTHPLLNAAQAYFAQPSHIKEAGRASEHREIGYKSTALSERYFIRHANMPRVVQDEATAFWSWAVKLARSLLTDIAHDLSIAPQELLALADLPNAPPRAPGRSILRLIRGLPTSSDDMATAPHTDLGLLAIGVRLKPGLQALHPQFRHAWLNVEHGLAPHDVVVMVGDSLHNVTNRTYWSCKHRVLAGTDERYSLVFHVRLRPDVMLESRRLSNRHKPFDVPFCERSDRYIRRLLQSGTRPDEAAPPRMLATIAESDAHGDPDR